MRPLRRSHNQAHAGFVYRQTSDPKSGTLLKEFVDYVNQLPQTAKPSRWFQR